MKEFLANFAEPLQQLQAFLVIINALLHVMFAGGVARDAGNLQSMGRKTAIVSAHVWAFAALLGGVMVAVAYWILHHSTLTIERSVNLGRGPLGRSLD